MTFNKNYLRNVRSWETMEKVFEGCILDDEQLERIMRVPQLFIKPKEMVTFNYLQQKLLMTCLFQRMLKTLNASVIIFHSNSI